jgi:hypothetical protein
MTETQTEVINGNPVEVQVIPAGNPTQEEAVDIPGLSYNQADGTWTAEIAAADGRPQRFTAPTRVKLIAELMKAKAHADSHIQRLKSRPSPTPKRNEVHPLTVDDEFQLGIELQNPATAAKAIKRVLEAEIAPEREQARIARVTYEFARRHVNDPRLFDCEANGRMLAQWVADNGFEYTVDNLEIALEECQGRLAQAPQAQNEQVVTQQQPEIPVEQQRPIRSAPSSIQPGQFSGNRPATRQKGLTKQDYIKMGRENPAEYRRHMSNPQLRAELERVVNS